MHKIVFLLLITLSFLNAIPNKIYASNPTLLYLLYAIYKDKIAGVNFEWNKFERPYLSQNVLNQPVVGGFCGQGKIPNLEMVISLKPDLILTNKGNQRKSFELFGNLGIEILELKTLKLEDYIDSIAILGEKLNLNERTIKLIKSAKDSLEFVKNLENYIQKSGKSRVKIYYAQGSDGLQTECDGSLYAALIPLCGGVNPLKCESSSYGKVKVSFEEVIKLDPDIIITYDKNFLDFAKNDKKWNLLKAVENGKIYQIPRKPFNWFDRPPSFMRFLGIKWLSNLAYPEFANLDIKQIL